VRDRGDTNAVIEVITQDSEPILVGMRDGNIKTITRKHDGYKIKGSDPFSNEITKAS
jgi:hypothetical protein